MRAGAERAADARAGVAPRVGERLGDTGTRRWRPDALALLGLLGLVGVALRPVLAGDTLVGLDGAAFFYPMWSFLGERLRAGDVPGWNPHTFSGAPFAADPQSGWMYGPVVLLFSLLPLGAAVEGLIAVHLLLATLGAYALARVQGLGVAGAGLAAGTYGLGPFVFERTACCPGFPAVLAWLPLLILCAELAIRAERPLVRTAWWGAAGLALGQVLGLWLGQGALYAIHALAGYVAYRVLLAPGAGGHPLPRRFGAAALHLGAILLFAFGLAAAGVLPRLEYNALSNLAGGYTGTPRGVTGGALGEGNTWGEVLGTGRWYPDWATVALAVVAPFVARWRGHAPYWAAVGASALILSTNVATPLHWLFSLLPGFARLHPHNPERVLMAAYLAAALLAGATVDGVLRRGRGSIRLVLVPGLVLAALLAAGAVAPGVDVPFPMAAALLAVAAFLAPYAGAAGRRRLATALLLLAVAADLLAAGRAVIEAELTPTGPHDPFVLRRVDLGTYYGPSAAARFLQSQGERGLSRYVGYDPLPADRYGPYPIRYYEPAVAALEVNNRAMPQGLMDVQGHNPIHVARYDEYLAALNGSPQNYHDSFVLPGGVGSPLLDLLGARHVVVPAATPPGRADLRRLAALYPEVYADDRVRILEHRGALPRAWVVHEARLVEGREGLRLVAAGEVDPRRTVLLEDDPPPLAPSADAGRDRAVVTAYEPDELRLRTTTAGAGMLALGDVYDPAWRAYVDGVPARVYPAYHALRAVPLPAGEHEVVLRYESAALRVGTAISAVAFGVLGVVVLAAVRGAVRERGGRRARWRQR